MQSQKKLWTMRENIIEILNLPQQKEDGTIQYEDPHYHTTKFFIEHLLAIEMEKREILMNKPVYLGL